MWIGRVGKRNPRGRSQANTKPTQWHGSIRPIGLTPSDSAALGRDNLCLGDSTGVMEALLDTVEPAR